MVQKYVETLLEKADGLSDEEKQTLAESLPEKTYGKGHHLLRQGEPYRECFYLFKGCIRQYFLDDSGNEKTVAFFTEGDTAALLDADYLKNPSPYFWECTEESTVLVGDLTNESDILDRYPSLQKLIRQMLEENLGKSQASLSTFISSTRGLRWP